MSSSDPSRLVNRENDVLYRKVHPDFWDKATNELKPLAFRDPGKPYTGLSFFVGRFKTPDKVLEFFAGMAEVKAVVGDTAVPIRAIDMFDHGFRIAKIPASVMNVIEAKFNLTLKCESKDGNEIDHKGHISIVDGKNYAFDFLDYAVLMNEKETFADV